MPSGAFKLGELFGGGGASSEMAQIAGEKARGELDHLSAQTQAALEKAKSEQLAARKAKREMDADDDFASGLVTMGVAKDLNEGLAMAGAARAGYADLPKLTTVRGDLRKQGYGDTLADELAPPAKRIAASSALKGEVQSPFQQVPGEYVDLTKPNAGVQTSPNVSSQILDRKTRMENPEKFRQTPKTVEEIEAEAAARARGTGTAQVALDKPRARAMMENFNAKHDAIEQTAEQLASDESLWQGVGLAKTVGEIRGTAGARIKAMIQKLQAKLAVQAVNDARALSKTGGAYGNTNAKEWEDLSRSIAALDPNMSPDDFRRELFSLADDSRSAKARSLKAFQETYPDEAPKPAAPGGPPSPTAASKPKTIKQGGYTYTLNEATGEYE